MTTKLLLAAAAVATIVVVASKEKAPEGPVPPINPIPGTPQGGGGGGPVAALALTSIPLAGPTHNGILRTDGTWTIATNTGSLVAEGTGEEMFLGAWLLYTNDGMRGVLLQGANELGGFTVRPPPCAPGAPNRWCYITSAQPGLVRRSANRAAALSTALARARAGL